MGAFVFQTFSTILLVAFARKSESFTATLLFACRAAKAALVLAGLIQWARHKVSFYHLALLSTLAQLLTVTDHGESLYAQLSEPPERSPLTIGARMVGILASVIHIAIMIPLVILTGLYSITEFSRPCFQKGVPFGFSGEEMISWNQANLWAVIPSIVLEAFLIKRNLAPTHLILQNQQNLTLPWDPFIHSMLFAIVLACLSGSTVSWLRRVDNRADAQWGLGQIIAIIMVVITLVPQTVDYFWSTTNWDDIDVLSYLQGLFHSGIGSSYTPS